MIEWTHPNQSPGMQMAHPSTRMFLFVHEAKDGAITWTAIASRWVEGLRWLRPRVDGTAATIDAAKAAAETMGRRMRKVLRWVR